VKQTDHRAPFLEGVAVLALALSVRLLGIGQDAGGDELYHILAAKQYLVDGTLRIHGALPYTRGEAFTLLVAWMFRFFGESPIVARIPSLIAGALVPLVAFLWLRSLGERAGAWLAGILLALEPDLIKLSQWARFYTVQHLAFLLGVIAVFALLSGPRKPARVVSLLALASLSFWLSLHLQVITKIGLMGLGAFVSALAIPALFAPASRGKRTWVVPLFLAAAGVVVVLLAVRLGIAREMRQLATEVDLWAAKDARNWKYYHWLFQESYPTFWPLYPILLLICAAAQPRLALLCGSVFGTALLAHSVVAMKHPRYICYVLPFFLIPCAVAVARTVPRVVSLVEGIDFPPFRTRSARRLAACALVGACAVFAVLANPAYNRTLRLLTLDPTLRQPGMEQEGLSWSRAAAELRPLAEKAEVVVSADDLSTLYYLGRLDYAISATQLDLEKTGREFTPDQSTNVPLVSRPESIERIMACHASGLIVGRVWALQTEWAVPAKTARYIAENAVRVPLPEAWGIEAFSWSHAPGRSLRPDCPESGPIREEPPH
jgi:hypothetical protein